MLKEYPKKIIYAFFTQTNFSNNAKNTSNKKYIQIKQHRTHKTYKKIYIMIKLCFSGVISLR